MPKISPKSLAKRTGTASGTSGRRTSHGMSGGGGKGK